MLGSSCCATDGDRVVAGRERCLGDGAGRAEAVADLALAGAGVPGLVRRTADHAADHPDDQGEHGHHRPQPTRHATARDWRGGSAAQAMGRSAAAGRAAGGHDVVGRRRRVPGPEASTGAAAAARAAAARSRRRRRSAARCRRRHRDARRSRRPDSPRVRPSRRECARGPSGPTARVYDAGPASTAGCPDGRNRATVARGQELTVDDRGDRVDQRGAERLPPGRTIAPGALAGEAPRASTPITAAPTAPLLMPVKPRCAGTGPLPRRRAASSCGSAQSAAIPWKRSEPLRWDGAVGAGVLHGGEPGLHPALALDGVAALVAGVDVLPGPLLVGRGQLAVEERADAGAEVADHGADHDLSRRPWMPGSGSGPPKRVRPSTGARWASAVRSIARPRWMRERTVPSLASRIAAISS